MKTARGERSRAATDPIGFLCVSVPLVVADTEHQWRSVTSADENIRLARAERDEGEDSLELRERLSHRER
jgi:hypothetical protein